MKTGKHIRYYQEETDDFLVIKNKLNVLIDGSYEFISRNPLYNLFSFALYYLVAIPVLFFFGYFIRGVRVKGRKNVKRLRTGYILYGNHTNFIDSFLGHVFIARPRRTYIISSKDAVS